MTQSRTTPRPSAARKTTTRIIKTPAKKTPSSATAKRSAATKTALQIAHKPIQAAEPDNVTKGKAPKVKKAKLVRDSFTIPKSEYEVIHTLKTRSQKMGHAVKKSELLRAGIKLLEALNDTAFKAALLQVPIIKTGRPKSAK